MFLGMRPFVSTLLLLLHVSLLFSNLVFWAWAQFVSEPMPKAPKNSVSTIYVFGDSTVDPGNNNYITTAFKSNFAPYGRDFPNHVASGRFTNGRLATDFIAKYVGVKELVPPYLNKSLSMEELMSGVSFASAGSGHDPLTPRLSGVIPMSKQLEYFKEYRSRIEPIMGAQKVNEHFHKALFIISAGTNDFVVNYLTVPIRRKMYNVTEYEQFLVQNVHDLIKSLWDLGARKIGIVGIPPMGCLPAVITMKSSNSVTKRGCIDSISTIARDYNKLLQTYLIAMQLNFDDSSTKIVYVDVYSPLADMVQGHSISNYGFEQVSSGCCGSGYLEAAFLCNRASYVCSDASKYVFWDSIHPTEMTYYLVFKTLRPVVDFIIGET